MSKYILISFITLLTCTTILSQETNYDGSVRTTFGATFTSFNSNEGEDSYLELLFNILANFNYEGSNFNFDSDFFIQYGQIVRRNSLPQKTQDNFIINLMPSIKIMEAPSIRLFLQSKAETQLRKGYLDDQETHFADPMFLTNTIFIGEKSKLIEQTETQQLNVTYGMGYSFQNIIKNKLQLTSEIQPSSSAEFIDGPTAILNFNLLKSISDDIEFNTSFSSLLLAKRSFLESVKNSRFSSLLIASLKIWLINIEYTNRIVYDNELSKKRTLEQSLIFGFKVDF